MARGGLGRPDGPDRMAQPRDQVSYRQSAIRSARPLIGQGTPGRCRLVSVPLQCGCGRPARPGLAG
jgi:hypothetical protein